MDIVDLIKGVTRAVRAADELFEKVGGSSRHWVIECLLPCLADENLQIVPRGKYIIVLGGPGGVIVPDCKRCHGHVFLTGPTEDEPHFWVCPECGCKYYVRGEVDSSG